MSKHFMNTCLDGIFCQSEILLERFHMEFGTRSLRQLREGNLSERSELFPSRNVLSIFLVLSDIWVLSLKLMSDRIYRQFE